MTIVAGPEAPPRVDDADPSGAARWYADYEGGKPNAAQNVAHNCPADEILYGGAWGGGKSDWLIAEILKVLLTWPGSNGLLMRKTRPEIYQPGGIGHRLRERLPKSIARPSGDLWKFANGSLLMLGHLNNGDKDLKRYLGGEYGVIGIDQAEDFTEFQWTKLAGRLRMSGENREAMAAAGFRGRLLMTANPGGTSHEALKQRYVDPWPAGGRVFRPAPTQDAPEPRTRAFIPANVYDNIENVGEDYVRQLDEMDEEERRAAYGDWSVLKGSRFKTFRRDRHVVSPDDWPIPWSSKIRKCLAIDYGLDHPFCALWGALFDDYPPNGLLVVYREIVQAGLTPAQQGEMMRRAEHKEERGPGRPVAAVADPMCWRRAVNVVTPRTGGAEPKLDPPPGSIADTYMRSGIQVRRADNRRVEGWAEVADRLRVQSDGLPRVLIHETCTDLIRTLPWLKRNPKNPEDVLKIDGDDSGDTLRYLMMHFAIHRPGTMTEGPLAHKPSPVAKALPPARGRSASLRTRAF